MITDATYYVGEIHISQIGASASTKVNNTNSWTIFAEQYERELLTMALGERLFAEFYTNLETDGTVTVGADAKWTRLRNGHTYTKGNVQYYWKGLVNNETETFKQSLLAYYVYCKWSKNNVTQTTTLGAVKAGAENANNASAYPKIVNAWRKMYDWYYGENHHRTSPHIYMHRGVIIEDYFGNDNSKEVSLYTFLKDNESDYDNWFFTPIDNKNTWGV